MKPAKFFADISLL